MAELDLWKQLAAKERKGADPDGLVWETPEGLAVKPLWTRADVAGLDLPVAQAVTRPMFESMFAVPHGLDLSALAAGLGWEAVGASAAGSVVQALSRALQGGRHVIEVPVDRAANTAFHGTLGEAVRAGLRREPLS